MRERITRLWYAERWSVFTWLLLPLSWLFSCITRLRRSWYRLGMIKTWQAPVPVIIVGNISVGGNGKTPCVIWLANFLRAQGYTPGIVSRGYGGNGQLQAVLPTTSVRAVGDEAVLLAQRGGCPVVVGVDRVAAAQTLLRLYPCDIIISDDGLQHYRLGRQIEIIMVDGQRYFGNRRLLPAGPLREPLRRLQEADFVITHVNAGMKAAAGITQQRPPNEFDMRLAGATLVAVHDNTRQQPLAAWVGRQVHAVAAIGNPQNFFTDLRAHGLNVIAHPLPDHYFLQAPNVTFADDLPVIMTEKDAVKCQEFITAAANCWYLPVQTLMAPELAASLLKKIGVTQHG